MTKRILRGLGACLSLFCSLILAAAAPSVRVSLITDAAADPPARHGIRKLKEALAARQIACEEIGDAAKARGALLLVAGTSAKSGPAAKLAEAWHAAPPSGPESLAVRQAHWKGKPALLVAGSDATGLMYALLDIADRVAWAPDPAKPFSEVRDIVEQPSVPERSVSMFTMQQAHFEARLHDERHWERYFDTLARNRFDFFELLFAYEMDGYMYPMFPYFFDVEGFPDVRVHGLSKEQQARNLADLKRMIRMAHERGIKVRLGLWDHIYRNMGREWTPFYSGDQPAAGKVWGVTDQNLVPYHRAALARFLHTLPEVDMVTFQLHGESGLRIEEMRGFWMNMFEVLKQNAPNLPYEAHGKGVPDDLIQAALDMGLNFRKNTKYWCEQLGEPYHPTHIQYGNQFDRRHDYSDMFRRPELCPVHWVLWTSGTVRVLLWGDPDYVKRFAESTHFGTGYGFTIYEPLATKMAAHPHDMKPFDLLRPQYRYYDYEFERWWHFFQVFGRVSYNPATAPETWDREFERRFGKDAGPVVEEALHAASRILPRINAYNLPIYRFPTTRGWVEKQRREDLPVYAKAETSDTQQFESFDNEALNLVEGRESARIGTLKSGEWFARASENVLRLASGAELRIGAHRNKEFDSTLVDLRILANLALYHSRRAPAGLSYAVFLRTRDLNALDDAIAHEQNAIEAWQRIVTAAGDVYNDDLMMGLPSAGLSGHWKDELVDLNKGLAALKQERAAFRPQPRREIARLDPSSVGRDGVLSVDMPAGDYELTVTIDGEAGPMWIEANGASYTDTFRVPAGRKIEKRLFTRVAGNKLHIVFNATSDGHWKAGPITVARVDPLIAHTPVRRNAPGRDLTIRATVSAIDRVTGVRLVYGNMDSGFRSQPLAGGGEYLYRAVVPAAQVTDGMEYFLEAADSAGRTARWPATGKIAVRVSADHEPPAVVHEPVTRAEPNKPLRIAARVSDPAGVKWVRLRYRGVTQHQDFGTLEMLPTGEKNEYAAEVPAAQLDPKFDFMYLIEVMDRVGNAAIYPDLEKATPYVVVKRLGQP